MNFFNEKKVIFLLIFIKLISISATVLFKIPTPSQINLIKNAKNHFLLIKKFKNTESAQLCDSLSCVGQSFYLHGDCIGGLQGQVYWLIESNINSVYSPSKCCTIMALPCHVSFTKLFHPFNIISITFNLFSFPSHLSIYSFSSRHLPLQRKPDSPKDHDKNRFI